MTGEKNTNKRPSRVPVELCCSDQRSELPQLLKTHVYLETKQNTRKCRKFSSFPLQFDGLENVHPLRYGYFGYLCSILLCKFPFLVENTSSTGPFSIAMLVYWGVVGEEMMVGRLRSFWDNKFSGAR